MSVEVRSAGIVLTPQVVVDRSKFPSAAGDYTAAQRKAVDKRLDTADAEPAVGPFRSGAEVEALLRKQRLRPIKKAR